MPLPLYLYWVVPFTKVLHFNVVVVVVATVVGGAVVGGAVVVVVVGTCVLHQPPLL